VGLARKLVASHTCADAAAGSINRLARYGRPGSSRRASLQQRCDALSRAREGEIDCFARVMKTR